MTVKIGKESGYLHFKRVDDTLVEVNFFSKNSISFYHKDKKEYLRSIPEEITFLVSVKDILRLYLALKNKENIIVKHDHILFSAYQKDGQYMIKGLDYYMETGGVLYIDQMNYPYVLLLSYLKAFLSHYNVLTFDIMENIYLTLHRSELGKEMFIVDNEIGKTYFIDYDQLAAMEELYDYYVENGVVFTHSFTPDKNVFVDKSGAFVISGRRYDFSVFKKLVEIIRI